MENSLFQDRSMEVIRAITQRHLSQLQSQTDPISCDVREVIEVNAADRDRAQGIVTGGRNTYGDFVVVRLIGERDKSGEAACLRLKVAQLPEMIDPVCQRLDMPKEHGASAAPAHLMPGPVHVQILRRRLLAPGDGGAHGGAK